MESKKKNVRVALCDNHWWQAELKRGYLYGQDSIEDRPPRTPPPYQNAWYFNGGILFQKGECYAQIYRMFLAQAAPTTTTAATISRAGRTSKSPVPPATS